MKYRSVTLVACSALALGIVSSAVAVNGSAKIPTITVVTSANGKAFIQKKLTVPAGVEFEVIFRNNTSKQHNVSLEQGEIEFGATQTIGNGSTFAIFTLKKGVYHFYSSVGNDENTGMSGSLTAT